MKEGNVIEQLRERNLIDQVTKEKNLVKRLKEGRISLYCGFDPTADSLHLGHLIPILCLKRFQQEGHKPIVLIGNATGLIGDPSFKKIKRKINSEETVQEWTDKISKQITYFLDFNCGENSAIIVYNYEWFCNMKMLTFLHEIGRYFPVNHIINKEAVRQRLNRSDYGISFTEFSYNLLQGYDFSYLNKFYNVILQIGGSDQWGNIISGINLTRRLYQNQVFGLTLPLIIKSDGTKFGKTESCTIWLDPKKTSPYKFYQFWINTTDSDVYHFLKFFTFMSIKEINDLEKDQNSNKTAQAQYILAERITKIVHGKEGLEAAKRITTSLFKGMLSNLTETDFSQLVQDGIPMIEIEKNCNLIQVLVKSELQESYRKASKIIADHAITVNGEKQSNPKYIFTDKDRLFGRYTFLRQGKKNFCLICWK